MCHVTLWVGFPHPKYHTAKFMVHRPSEKGNITFFNYRDIELSRDFVGEVPSS